MKNKFLCFVLSAVLCAAVFPPAIAENAGECTAVQAYIDQSMLDIVARGNFDLQNAVVKVANKQAEIVESGSVADGAVRVRTTILADVSTSIPTETREKVLEFIEAEIRDLADYEELRLVTFGDKVEVIEDFSSDRYDLSNAVKAIEFTAPESTVYDAINSTMNSPAAGCYNRTIVITDGADYAAGGITKEELFIRLGAEMYPIDVVGVSKEKLQNPNKDLAALARISRGNYTELYPEADVSECADDLSVNDLFRLRAEVPANLLDGSVRQVDVSDGVNSISFDMKMSVADMPEESTASAAESNVSEDISEAGAPAENSAVRFSTSALLVIACAGVSVIAIVVVILQILKSKKSAEAEKTASQSPSFLSDDSDKTEFADSSDSGEQYVVRLSNTANPNECWVINVTSDIVIGRAAECAVHIDEKSVSREQCRIAVKGAGLALSNLSGSNPTKLNGAEVSGDMLLHAADNIHFGRITLRVDYIQKIGEDFSAPRDNKTGGDTEAIF